MFLPFLIGKNMLTFFLNSSFDLDQNLLYCLLHPDPGRELPRYNRKPDSISEGQRKTEDRDRPLQIGRWQV